MKLGSIIIYLLLFLFTANSNAVIIRGESREQLTNTEHKYAKKVGLIVAWNNNSTKYVSCSASNIDPKYAITAAHCLIDIINAKPYDNIVYKPRYLGIGKVSPSKIFVTEIHVPIKYQKENQKLLFQPTVSLSAITPSMIANDIAVFKIFSDREQKYVGQAYGWYGLQTNKHLFEKENIKDIHISSYPSDKEKHTLWYEECFAISDNRYYNYSNVGKTNCDIKKGASGAGIVDSELYLSGVISAESEETGINNIALITEEMLKEIKNIKSGYFKNNKIFEKINVNTKKTFSFYVKNECNKTVDVAIRFNNSKNEKWEMYISENVKQNERTKELPTSRNIHYSFVARTDDKRSVWHDPNSTYFSNVFGKNRGFLKKKASIEKPYLWGDWESSITCNK